MWPFGWIHGKIAQSRTRRALRNWAPRTHKYSPLTLAIYVLCLGTIVMYSLLAWMSPWLFGVALDWQSVFFVQAPVVVLIVTFLVERGVLFLKDRAAKFVPGILPAFPIVEYKRGQHVRRFTFNGRDVMKEMVRVGGFLSGVEENTGPIFTFKTFSRIRGLEALEPDVRKALLAVLGTEAWTKADAEIAKFARPRPDRAESSESEDEIVTGTIMLGKHVLAPHKWRPYVYISDEDEKRYGVRCHIPLVIKRWIESVYNGTDEPKVWTGAWVFDSDEAVPLQMGRPRAEDAGTEDRLKYWQERAKELESENEKLREKEAYILELQSEALEDYNAAVGSQEGQ